KYFLFQLARSLRPVYGYTAHLEDPRHQHMTELNELIEITRDGQQFYQHAMAEVKDVELQHLFRDMAQAKTHIIQALSVKVAAHQERPAQGGTLAGKWREMYADTKARLGDTDAVYVDQLDQTEEIGRASCRERVEISVVAGVLV